MVKAEAIDALLPQTQCRECGHDGCMPYAEAISRGEDTIDKCKPGGERTLHALSSLLSLDPTQYLAQVISQTKLPSVVVIDPSSCIGCTKCIQACPVDAIIGARKQMHAVIEDICTGCDLCIPACPVDCIHPLPMAHRDEQLLDTMAVESRKRYNQRSVRLHAEKTQRQIRYEQAKQWLETQS